ncbi:MAG TPA: P27 family phage terminase small subunit [Gemmatimonadaceae bacterium]|jgi:phage terminase small subunit|nr:P27 family phage terminase small subunit [Gemmatimonadaceae bacterium]
MAGNKNSGRRPQPTALKVLRGNPGKRKLNPDEPTPPPGDVVKPLTLSTPAAAVWDRLAPMAIAMRTLTSVDGTAFGMLCEVQATLEWAAGRKDPPPRNSGERPSQWVRRSHARLTAAIKIEKDFAPIIRPYYALFGLEPVSRSRIQVPKQHDETPATSKWAGVLK